MNQFPEKCETNKIYLQISAHFKISSPKVSLLENVFFAVTVRYS